MFALLPRSVRAIALVALLAPGLGLFAAQARSFGDGSLPFRLPTKWQGTYLLSQSQERSTIEFDLGEEAIADPTISCHLRDAEAYRMQNGSIFWRGQRQDLDYVCVSANSGVAVEFEFPVVLGGESAFAMMAVQFQPGARPDYDQWQVDGGLFFEVDGTRAGRVLASCSGSNC